MRPNFLALLLTAALLISSNEGQCEPSAAREIFPEPRVALRLLDQYLRSNSRSRNITPLPASGSPQRLKSISRYEVAKTPKGRLYALASEDISHSAQLLARRDPNDRLNGLCLALDVSFAAAYYIHDPELAAMVCDALIIPNLPFAEEDPTSGLSVQQILPEIATRYREAKKIGKFTEAYRKLFAVAPNENTKDATRIRIAEGLEAQGDLLGALEQLEAINPEEALAGGRNHIPTLYSNIQKLAK